MGMAWKAAVKALREYCGGNMTKELEGLEESLKGWEERDEHREKSFQTWKAADAALRNEVDFLSKNRAENLVLKSDLDAVTKRAAAYSEILDKQNEEMTRLKACLKCDKQYAMTEDTYGHCGREIGHDGDHGRN